MRRMFARALTIFLASILVLSSATLASPSAEATSWDPHVHMSGHIDCGGLDSATWVWYEASNGERGWADLVPWTSVNRLVRGIWRWVKVQTYDLHLWKVPKDGTWLYMTIGCRNPYTGASFELRANYSVTRPNFGTKGTRHVCRSAFLGCVV